MTFQNPSGSGDSPSGSASDRAKDAASKAFGDVSDGAEKVAKHPWFHKAARAGYIANGILHIVIGLIAWNLAFGSAPEDADQSGAIQLMAESPLGMVLVWLCAIGCGLLGLWHISEAVWEDDSWKDRIKDLAEAVIYIAIGVAFTTAAFGGSQDSGETASNLSGQLMSNPVGAIALILVGAGIIVVGGYQVYKGVTRKFMEDIRSSSKREITKAVEVIGTVGCIAKGIVLGLVGLLFVIATVRHDPEDATGMDGALRALLDQPFGEILLAAVGVGLVAFGVYSIARSRYEVQ